MGKIPKITIFHGKNPQKVGTSIPSIPTPGDDGHPNRGPHLSPRQVGPLPPLLQRLQALLLRSVAGALLQRPLRGGNGPAGSAQTQQGLRVGWMDIY